MKYYAVAKRSGTKTKSGRQVRDDGFKGRQYQIDVRLNFFPFWLNNYSLDF